SGNHRPVALGVPLPDPIGGCSSRGVVKVLRYIEVARLVRRESSWKVDPCTAAVIGGEHRPVALGVPLLAQVIALAVAGRSGDVEVADRIHREDGIADLAEGAAWSGNHG